MTLDPASLARLAGVHPVMVRCVTAAYGMMPYGFRVVQGLRTAAQQAALYAIGRTLPGHVVTFKSGAPGNESNHQAHGDGLGWAVDLMARNDLGGIMADNDPNLPAAYKALYDTMFNAWRASFAPDASGFVLRSGSDWNMNGVRCEHGETDLGHFELHRSVPLAKAMAA